MTKGSTMKRLLTKRTAMKKLTTQGLNDRAMG